MPRSTVPKHLIMPSLGHTMLAAVGVVAAIVCLVTVVDVTDANDVDAGNGTANNKPSTKRVNSTCIGWVCPKMAYL